MLNLTTSEGPRTAIPFLVPPVSIGRWYAVHVKHNFEFKVSDRLTAFGVESFLPRYTSMRQWKDRRTHLELPLFPGYLFARFDWRDKLRIVTHHGVLSILGGPLASVDDPIVDQLRLAVETKSATPYDLPAIQPGDRVQIISGPFRGMEGCLDRCKSSCRVIVTVAAVARCFALEVDRREIELLPLHTPAIA